MVRLQRWRGEAEIEESKARRDLRKDRRRSIGRGSQVDGILGDEQMGESGIGIMDLQFLIGHA